MRFLTDGIVIKETSLGESDRIVTILTRKHGVIRAFVRGASNIKNPKCASTRLLCYSDMTVYEGRDKYIVDSSEAKEMFIALRNDVSKMALAQYFCEISALIAPSGESADGFLQLMLNSLYALCKDLKPQKLIKGVFELRILSLAGYMPDLTCCLKCSRFEDEDMRFIPDTGKLICGNCLKENTHKVIKAGISATNAMRHAIYADARKIFSFQISTESLRTFSESCEEYLMQNIDKKPMTLEFYKTMAD